MTSLQAAWEHAVGRYPYLAELPPFKTKWLYEAYEAMFARLGPVRTILELGMYQGGSVVLWREALACRVIGIDLSAPPKTAPLLERYIRESRSEGEVHCYWRTNQMDAESLFEIVARKVAGALDIVIDDASHLYVPTQRSFEILFPLVRPGGVYVIEDWLAGRRPDFQSADGPIARLVHELIDNLGSATWPIASIEIRPACVVVLKTEAAAGLVLRELLPARTAVGVSFNTQPNGASALAAACTDASRDSVIVFAGTPLATTFGSPSLLTAIVPADLLTRAGAYEVFIRRNATESNRLQFTVEAA
jgi:predicted O-methyltransferase YrrM